MAANGGGHAAGMEANGPAVENGVGPAPVVAVPAGGGGNVAPALRLRSLPEEALYQVLVRLPVAEISRCRTVSQLWRDVPSGDEFRDDQHHNHGRIMPLFFYSLDHLAAPPLDYNDRVRVNLRAIDIGGRASLPVLRFEHLLPNPPRPVTDQPPVVRIQGSCQGILLLSYGDELYACNPGTRRWARLPPLHDLGDIAGFYPHVRHASRSYRVLFHMDARRQVPDRRYWVMRLSSSQDENNPIRYIGRRADLGDVHRVQGIGRPNNLEDARRVQELELEDVRRLLAAGIPPSFEMPPVMVDEILHWLPRVRQGQGRSYLLMFHTVDEQFRWILPPVEEERGRLIQVVGDQLLEIDGRLAITRVAQTSVDVWVRQYHPYYMPAAWTWSYSIQLPDAVIQDHHGYDGAVFVVSQGQNVLVQCRYAILQCDAKGNVLQTYQLDDNCTRLSRYVLHDSLALHSFLPLQPGDARDGDPPFFQAP
ncbi:hypothetical protein BS78_10G247500 [Paspalum vaginatum]|nr:hypothetical protein BS78_10G247500 [Paspalum vaginatum]